MTTKNEGQQEFATTVRPFYLGASQRLKPTETFCVQFGDEDGPEFPDFASAVAYGAAEVVAVARTGGRRKGAQRICAQNVGEILTGEADGWNAYVIGIYRHGTRPSLSFECYEPEFVIVADEIY